MTLRERIQLGSERRRRQEPCSEFRRRTDKVLAVPVDNRPMWLRRALPVKDETGAVLG